MRRRTALLTLALAAASFAVPAGSSASSISKVPVSFDVTNPGDPLGPNWTIKGFLMLPAGCTPSGVMLALHGLSYGQWAWDFPLRPETYSVAQALAAKGYATIAIDLLGYGESHKEIPNGYTLSVEAYAMMTSQIIGQIRDGFYEGPAFSKVGLIGHSAGSEIAELTTALYPDSVDALIATAYTHEPWVNNDWLLREWTQDNQRALLDDYEEFETDQPTRDADMYSAFTNSDADIRQLDWDLHNKTPSGEILSIGLQPSRFLLPLIAKPVLVLLAADDVLFPGHIEGPNEMLWFVQAEATLKVVENAGHVFMLEHNAPVANQMIIDWLDAHSGAVPACSP